MSSGRPRQMLIFAPEITLHLMQRLPLWKDWSPVSSAGSILPPLPSSPQGHKHPCSWGRWDFTISVSPGSSICLMIREADQ